MTLKKIGTIFGTMAIGSWVLKILYGIFVFLGWCYDEMGGIWIGVLVLMAVCWALGAVATKVGGSIEGFSWGYHKPKPAAPPLPDGIETLSSAHAASEAERLRVEI